MGCNQDLWRAQVDSKLNQQRRCVLACIPMRRLSHTKPRVRILLWRWSYPSTGHWVFPGRHSSHHYSFSKHLWSADIKYPKSWWTHPVGKMSVIIIKSSPKSSSLGMWNNVVSANGTLKYCACDPSRATDPKDLHLTHRPVIPLLQWKHSPLDMY